MALIVSDGRWFCLMTTRVGGRYPRDELWPLLLYLSFDCEMANFDYMSGYKILPSSNSSRRFPNCVACEEC